VRVRVVPVGCQRGTDDEVACWVSCAPSHSWERCAPKINAPTRTPTPFQVMGPVSLAVIVVFRVLVCGMTFVGLLCVLASGGQV